MNKSIPVMIPVICKGVKAVGYDSKFLKMFVEYDNGAIYSYYRTTQAVFDAFLEIKNKRSYLEQRIKHNCYSRKRVRKAGEFDIETHVFSSNVITGANKVAYVGDIVELCIFGSWIIFDKSDCIAIAKGAKLKSKDLK